MKTGSFARLAVFAAASLTLSVTGGALAQVRPQPIAPRGPVPAGPLAAGAPKPIAPINLRPMRIPAELQQLLLTKRTFNQALLQQSLSYRGNIPLLRLKNNATVRLEPVSAEAPAPAAVALAASTLDPALGKYKTHIQSKWIGRVTKLPPALLGVVDHSARQSAIKNQGDRGTCVAHASMAGLESFYKWKFDVSKDLSENHAYHVFMSQEGHTCPADPGIQTWKAANYLKAYGVCNEAGFPYTTEAALPANDGTHVPPACASSAPARFLDTQILFGTEFGGGAEINANNTNYLESILNDGNDVVYGMYVAGTDWNDGTSESGVIDVQTTAGGQPAAAYAGHAMLLVGYNRPANYFIFKNSWTADRGHGGYFYISYEYVQTYGKYGYYIKQATAP